MNIVVLLIATSPEAMMHGEITIVSFRWIINSGLDHFLISPRYNVTTFTTFLLCKELVWAAQPGFVDNN